MKKYLMTASITTLLIFTCLLSGCTQDNNNVKPEEIEIISHKVATYGNLTSGFVEVTGSLKNIGNRTIDVIAEVTFLNKNNEVLYVGTYTIYNFVSGVIEHFIVEFLANQPNYEDYDHYSIRLIYE